jgi:exopolysaccharide production protein ExoQ
MPPVLALCLTFAFIYFLFWRERREEYKSSPALWIPLAWLLITGSRFPTQWLSMVGILHMEGEAAMEEGSPLDAAFFFLLIASGYYVLKQRNVTVSSFFRHNRWLAYFLLYCLVAILWSDFPFVALKRWIKVLGHPIMALIVLTESDPEAAVRRVLKRMAYVLLLVSILLIKYYPQYGRGWDPWTGLSGNNGVGHNKNELGYDCLISGLFFFWNLLGAFSIKDRMAKLKELHLSIGFLGLSVWLLKLASSATSLSTMLIGMATMVVVSLPFINKRHLGIYVIVGALVFAVVSRRSASTRTS